MSLEDFHRNFRSTLQSLVVGRAEADEGPFPSEELVFAEMVMEHLAAAGISETPTVGHWSGRVGNAQLRVTGHALSADETALDLFVAHYFGTDELSELKDAEAAATAAEGVRFLIRAASGSLDSKLDPTHPVGDLVATIRARWSGLDRLRVFVITDGRTKVKRFADKEIEGKMVGVEAMDMERLFRHAEGRPRDEIAVSFVQSIGRPLPCVHVPDPDADYEYALTALPGGLLRDLYLRFGARLLEANVRTFLGARKTVNKGVVETLRKEPEHFLAFNNGLVLVCDEAVFERSPEGGVGLTFLRGMQIVNGGQTTATLYFASREDRTIDLSHVMVPAKIVILKEARDEARERLISSISRYANSQNAVKMSDLSANRPFHVQLEKLANEVWCPDGATRWFYERAAGAYNVMLLREGTAARRRKLQETIPPKRKLTKNDVARYHEAWRARPDQVALGAEKNFAAFMAALDETPGIVPHPLDARWFRGMIARAILFRAVESLLRTGDARRIFRQGLINIAAYVVSLAAEKFGERLDFEQIWMRQGISDGLRDLLRDWAVVVNDGFARHAPGQQISEAAKRPDVWRAVRAEAYPQPTGRISEIAGT
ncbi:AIPR family protein [Neomegalonema sp.]|uniref:AIPR family protein n=1 Tax=Neomegalonema sp. TaxID=2039713 RepID=UPI002623BD21|nr:AIPR family protein [Neomegalonema sp.]MDD2868649.1 AIPR family protein [Neomegalonema sp.]